MPSTYDTLNRVELQNPGENLNTWGAKLNNDTTVLLSFAISGVTSLALSGPITLTASNGVADQSRSAILNFTSGSGGTVTIPAVSHVYQVRNACSGNLVFTTGSGTTATVEPGSLGHGDQRRHELLSLRRRSRHCGLPGDGRSLHGRGSVLLGVGQPAGPGRQRRQVPPDQRHDANMGGDLVGRRDGRARLHAAGRAGLCRR